MSEPATPSGPLSTARRKAEHLRINLGEQVGGEISSGFERYAFEHLALPEIDLDQVDLSTTLLGHPLEAPLLISCMTGGTAEAATINRRLAAAAQEHGLAVGLGSGRVLLENPGAPGFEVRDVAPDVLLLANLGAIQLNRGVTPGDCRRLLRATGADALVLHLNPLQEAIQPGGDTGFGGLLRRIRQLCLELEAPVLVKEVGWGLAPDVVADLLAAGVAAVDVAGAGGTSWSAVESHRLEAVDRAAAREFAGWGIPTAEALVAARAAHPGAVIIASGGIRSGMDVARAIALGADAAGLAGPFLRAAAAGPGVTGDLASGLIRVLRLAMFAVGAPNLAEFRRTPRLRRLE